MDKHQVENYLNLMTQLKHAPIRKKEVKDFIVQASPLINNNFLTSFLVLSLLVSVYRSEQELPTTKTQLYNKCFQYVIKQREKSGNKSSYNINKFQHLLDQDHTFEELAFLGKYTNLNIGSSTIKQHISDQYSRFYGTQALAYEAVSEFLEFCEDRTEFYVKGTIEDTYKFFHRSFFDYYFSKYIVRVNSDYKLLFNVLINAPQDSEIFELVAEFLRIRNYPKYLEFYDFILSMDLNELLDNSMNINEGLDTITLITSHVNEDDILETYVSKLLTWNPDRLSTGRVAFEIVERVGKSKILVNYIQEDYNMDIWIAMILYNIWRINSNQGFNLFKTIGHKYFNFYFEMIVHFDGIDFRDIEIPVYEKLYNYFETHTSALNDETFAFMFKTSYDTLISKIHSSIYHKFQTIKMFKANLEQNRK